MASGIRDDNNIVVLQGVHFQTGEIVPVKIDNTTGSLLMTVIGVTDPGGPTLTRNSLHDDNNVPTMLAEEDGTVDNAVPTIDNRTVNSFGGQLWITIVP